jgi:hypothetical protein
MIINSSNPRTTKGMELNGNVLSGDTYGMRSYIKEHWDGKWDAANKAWIVNPEKVLSTIKEQAWGFTRILSISNETLPANVETTKRDNWYVNTKYGRELGEDY